MILAGLLAGCEGEASDRNIRTLRLGHGLDPSHPVYKAMEFMAQRVAGKAVEVVGEPQK
jgi:TRAP-type C4-dicarboxylate transport system substrate-binding protein